MLAHTCTLNRASPFERETERSTERVRALSAADAVRLMLQKCWIHEYVP